MIPNDQSAAVTWTEGGVPVSDRFGDPYFSLKGGLEETRHVFLSGNGLPGRLLDGFHIAELGFGTGLNLAGASDRLGRDGPPRHPALHRVRGLPDAHRRHGNGACRLCRSPCRRSPASPAMGRRQDAPFPAGGEAEVLLGDARSTLPAWQGRADAWFLDGFSPARNPEMWEDAMLAQVARHTRPGGTFATYTAAGHVRRALAEAGFTVERRPGFGTKRHMTAGRLA